VDIHRLKKKKRGEWGEGGIKGKKAKKKRMPCNYESNFSII